MGKSCSDFAFHQFRQMSQLALHSTCILYSHRYWYSWVMDEIHILVVQYYCTCIFPYNSLSDTHTDCALGYWGDECKSSCADTCGGEGHFATCDALDGGCTCTDCWMGPTCAVCKLKKYILASIQCSFSEDDIFNFIQPLVKARVIHVYQTISNPFKRYVNIILLVNYTATRPLKIITLIIP